MPRRVNSSLLNSTKTNEERKRRTIAFPASKREETVSRSQSINSPSSLLPFYFVPCHSTVVYSTNLPPSRCRACVRPRCRRARPPLCKRGVAVQTFFAQRSFRAAIDAFSPTSPAKLDLIPFVLSAAASARDSFYLRPTPFHCVCKHFANGRLFRWLSVIIFLFDLFRFSLLMQICFLEELAVCEVFQVSRYWCLVDHSDYRIIKNVVHEKISISVLEGRTLSNGRNWQWWKSSPSVATCKILVGIRRDPSSSRDFLQTHMAAWIEFASSEQMIVPLLLHFFL